MTDGLNMAANQLQEAWQQLCNRWYETTQVWDDPIRRQFEMEFWQPLETQVTATQLELERLANGISKAHRSVH